MNDASAWAGSCVLAVVVPVLVESDALAVLLVLLVLESLDVLVALPVVVVPPTPICCSACANALMNPPGPPSAPGGGPGGPISFPCWLMPLVWPVLLDWLICVNQLNEPETLLIVMTISFLIEEMDRFQCLPSLPGSQVWKA